VHSEYLQHYSHTSVETLYRSTRTYNNKVLSTAGSAAAQWLQWLRHCAAGRKVSGSMPDEVNVFI
jgi:hypothetical protein